MFVAHLMLLIPEIRIPDSLIQNTRSCLAYECFNQNDR